jgi:histidinol phosphatase-like enzyme
LDILVKYCGGCNCQIDRSKIIGDIESSMGSGYHLTADTSGAPFDAGILVCGCLSACARKDELNDLTGHWTVIAGKTVDSRELPEDQLAAAVIGKIRRVTSDEQ